VIGAENFSQSPDIQTAIVARFHHQQSRPRTHILFPSGVATNISTFGPYSATTRITLPTAT